jgi:hypothetical protein
MHDKLLIGETHITSKVSMCNITKIRRVNVEDKFPAGSKVVGEHCHSWMQCNKIMCAKMLGCSVKLLHYLGCYPMMKY